MKRVLYDNFDHVVLPQGTSNHLLLDRYSRILQNADKILTSRQFELMQLYFIEGLNMSEIALKLGRNRSTVCRTIKNAKRKLAAFAAIAEKSGFFDPND